MRTIEELIEAINGSVITKLVGVQHVESGAEIVELLHLLKDNAVLHQTVADMRGDFVKEIGVYYTELCKRIINSANEELKSKLEQGLSDMEERIAVFSTEKSYTVANKHLLTPGHEDFTTRFSNVNFED